MFIVKTLGRYNPWRNDGSKATAIAREREMRKVERNALNALKHHTIVHDTLKFDKLRKITT